MRQEYFGLFIGSRPISAVTEKRVSLKVNAVCMSSVFAMLQLIQKVRDIYQLVTFPKRISVVTALSLTFLGLLLGRGL